MAESPESTKARPETWVLAGLAAAGLVCVSLVALGMVLILRQGQAPAAVTASPVINIQTAPAAAQGIVRPSEPPKPQAVRDAAQNPTQPALPLKLEVQGSVSRADQQAAGAAAKASLPAPNAKIHMLMRGDMPAPALAKNPLPMPVRYRVDARGQVADVFASRQPASAPLPPDRPYADSGSSGADVELQLVDPKATAEVEGFRAPEGFSFFTAKAQLRNKGAQPLKLDLGAFELRDAEGAVYLANPELSGALPAELAAGGQAEAGLVVLVSDQSPLAALALQTGAAPVLVPLARR